MNLPNKLTLMRVIMIPFFIVFLLIPITPYNNWIALAIFVIASLTDFLDGYFARKNNEVSDFGKLFDPFADVLLHLTTFFCFVVAGHMPAIVFILILYR